MKSSRWCPFIVAATAAFLTAATAEAQQPSWAIDDPVLAEYFRKETEKLTDACLADIRTRDDWESKKVEYRRQLREMLGLDPLPPRTPLQPVITGTIEQEDFAVENLHFQSLPGLYVTGNLYRPKTVTGKLPAILYVCGHARVVKDGVSFGNKTSYQHHGEWFARHGYVCLTIDTIQLGEIAGTHHGTYRYGMWWWNSRGYTPAGVEAWNCMRALDYLEMRPEVDATRFGITGRSGGGAYSWWAAAIDERIQAAVPVAGITSLKNHVVDGCVEGHCDCMFMVNTYRWDFPQVAALVAPRPLLISNSDKDRIFPLDGVVDVYTKTRRIYQLYDAADKLGLHITEGPHKDTQELQLHAFTWFDRWLKGGVVPIDEAARKFFQPEELRVFEELPKDERVTTIHESFVPQSSHRRYPGTHEGLLTAMQEWRSLLRHKCFRGWPQDDDADPLDVRLKRTRELEGALVSEYEFTGESPWRLTMVVVRPADLSDEDIHGVNAVVLSEDRWGDAPLPKAVQRTLDGEAIAEWKQNVAMFGEGRIVTVYLTGRGIGPTKWPSDDRKQVQIRRRFMLLGQTLAGQRIWDVRRGLQAMRRVDGLGPVPAVLTASGEAAVWATYAAIFEPGLVEIVLEDIPDAHDSDTDLLNISRLFDLQHAVFLAAANTHRLTLTSTKARDWGLWEEPVFAHETLSGYRRLETGD